jgi:predicted nucleic acid-binding protein
MATEVIVDSSVIVALVTLEKYSEWASKGVQEHEYFHVLDLTFYEVANAIRYKVSDNFTAKDAASAFKQAEKMMNLYSVHNFSEVTADALNKATRIKIVK